MPVREAVGAGRGGVGGVVRAAGACCALALLLVLVTGGVAQAAKDGLTLGIWDSVYLSDDSAERATWLDRTLDVGAQRVTLQANWRNIAPDKPADPTDPSDPAYRWGQLDAGLRDASARGLSIVLMLHQAPDWAEGPGRDPDAAPGTWRPDPDKLGQFARAIGKRYSGGFPDPLAPGQNLPRVGLWQIWGEPNIYLSFNPQWEKSGEKWHTASPALYRSMVNVAYSALKGVDPANRVIAGGLAPSGDYEPGSTRLEPLRFWRDFFCLRGRRALKPKSCHGEKPHLDILGGNPLSIFGGADAFESAAQPDDTYVPDMDQLTRIIRAARSHNRIVPRTGTDLWATELLASSTASLGAPKPASESTQATYLADALFVLWRQGVSNITWIGVSDAYLNSGLFHDDGTPKLAEQAFRFPFVVRPKRKHRVRVWGMAPTGGAVQIEQQTDSGWDAIETLESKGRVFTGQVKASKGAKLRATEGDQHSLAR